MKPATTPVKKAHLGKAIASYIGCCALSLGLPAAVAGAIFGGPVGAFIGFTLFGGAGGMLGAGLVALSNDPLERYFGVTKEQDSAPVRYAGAAIFGWASLCVAATGYYTDKAVANLHDVLRASASQAFDDAASVETAARASTATAAPVIVTAARADRPVSA